LRPLRGWWIGCWEWRSLECGRVFFIENCPQRSTDYNMDPAETRVLSITGHEADQNLTARDMKLTL
jgi:hypothetical protein